MAEEIYTCKDGTANKFWSYEIKNQGKHVIFKYGRIGRKINKTPKSGSIHSINVLIEKKIQEKLKKGYKKSDQKEISEDRQNAQLLGTQFKINKMEWVKMKDLDNSYDVIDSYDPDGHIYLEILNSWTKEKFHVVLSKTEIEYASGLKRSPKGILNLGRRLPEIPIEEGNLRALLIKFAKKVAQAVKIIRFGAVGVRNIQLEDDEDDDFIPTMQQSKKIIEELSDNSASDQVVMKFAALGCRSLDLD